MKIEDFWNQAFLAALGRLPVDSARQEADRALDACIAHWQSQAERLLMPVPGTWADGDVTQVPFYRGKPNPAS